MGVDRLTERVVICTKKSPELSCIEVFPEGGSSMWLDITVALIAVYLLTFTAVLVVEAVHTI
jgi:hypothetical protein